MNLEQALRKIEARNAKVETRKAWETSLFRRGLLTLFIYGMAVLVMWVAKVEQIWLASLVPAVGYFLSTVTVSPVREWWVKRFYQR